MITSLYIDNFKSFNSFQIKINPITVFVGNNGCGKSSLLQALDFLSCIVSNDFSTFLERRQLKVENIKSKQQPSAKQIRFSVIFKFPNIKYDLKWNISILTNISKNTMELFSESIESIDEKKSTKFLEYKMGSTFYITDDNGNQKHFMGAEELIYNSSVLKMINVSVSNTFPEIACIKNYLLNSDSFDLLNPDFMRQGTRGASQSIGNKGKQLASFIKSLSNEQKILLDNQIKSLYSSIQKVDTKTAKLAGWTTLSVEEKFKNIIKLSSMDLSDGTLRLIAFCALTQMLKDSGFVLLDEIENGINASNAKKIIEYLIDYATKQNRQLIITTHSTVFLDYINPENIVYMFREQDTGNSKCAYIFEKDFYKDKLDFMYPGEIFLNSTHSEIMEYLLENN